MHQGDRYAKVAGILACLFLSGGIGALQMAPAGYQVSMFTQAPAAVMLLGGVLIILGISTTMYSISIGRPDWRLLLPLYAVLFVALLGPYLLGYIIKYADAMIHLGNILDIVRTGSLPGGMFGARTYPHFHIHLAMMAFILGMPEYVLIALVPLLFGSLALIVVLLLGRWYQIPSTYPLLFIPLMWLLPLRSVTPSGVAYLTTFLLLVYLLETRPEMASWQLFTVFCCFTVGIWIQHLFVAALLLGVVISSYLAASGFSILQGGGMESPPPGYVLIFTVFGMVWVAILQTQLLQRGALVITQLIGAYSFKTQYEPGGGISRLFSELGFTIVDVVILALKRFGSWGVLLGLGTLGITIYLYQNRAHLDQPTIPAMAVGVSIVWSLAELTVGIIPSINWLRVLRPAVILSPIFAGLFLHRAFLYERIDNDSVRPVAAVLVAIILIIATFGSIGGMYRSPWMIDGNSYSTDSGLQTWQWYYDHKTDGNTVTLERNERRFAELVLSTDEEIERSKEIHNDIRAPPHFRENGQSLAELYPCSYYIEDKRSRYMNLESGYTEDFTHNEIEKVRHSTPSIQSVYTNGNWNISHMGAC
ncbi:hypothetical protein [Saliphagus infecundisoli]|uniref:Uncharacterized protein n=1 Tax=Saliphagus infecundisoli TaxID=1849069 RepID=A0ABD5QGX2_9EURY|nr:hypothetical protein [Saliphagus infecundisoli]